MGGLGRRLTVEGAGSVTVCFERISLGSEAFAELSIDSVVHCGRKANIRAAGAILSPRCIKLLF